MPAAAPTSVSTDALRAAFTAARLMCRRRSLDVYLACRCLPRGKADATCAVFAFFGMIADAIGAPELSVNAASAMREHPIIASPAQYASSGGGCGDSADGRIAMLRDRLVELYADEEIALPAVASRSPPQHVLAAMQTVVRRFQVPPSDFIDFAEGCRADLMVRRYATWSSLELYLNRRGGAVACAVTAVLGATHSDIRTHALQLGRAVRLTTILANLKRDFDAGWLYIPLEDVAKFRYTERDLAAQAVDERFRELMRFQIDRARQLYRDAADGLPWLAGDGSRLMAASVIAVHSGVVARIERNGYDVFRRRSALSAAEQLRRMPLAWRLTSREASDGDTPARLI
jgi:phytoene synthase